MAIIIVPGSGGPAPWQRHWLSELEDTRLVSADEVPGQLRAGWLARLGKAVQAAPGSILVGHGAGVHLIAHLAAERPELPVGGALLVGAVDVDARARAGDADASLAPTPVRPFAFPSLLVASRNDPALSFDKARVLANLWEAALVDLGRAGALSAGEGLGDWPDGRALLTRLEQMGPVGMPVRGPAGRPDAGLRGAA